jgi:hypothetical protein
VNLLHRPLIETYCGMCYSLCPDNLTHFSETLPFHPHAITRRDRGNSALASTGFTVIVHALWVKSIETSTLQVSAWEESFMLHPKVYPRGPR